MQRGLLAPVHAAGRRRRRSCSRSPSTRSPSSRSSATSSGSRAPGGLWPRRTTSPVRAGRARRPRARALEHGRRADDRLEVREIVEWLCVALMLGPTPAPDVARPLRRAAARTLRTDPFLEPTVLSVLANVEAMQGTWSRRTTFSHGGARRWTSSASRSGSSRSTSASSRWWTIRRRRTRAPARVRGSREDRREEPLLLGRRPAVTCDVRAGTLRRGRAAEPGERGGSTTERHPLPHPLAHHARAGPRAQRRARPRPRTLAREAVAFAAESDFLDSHGDALVSLATVLRLAGRPQEAGTALEGALQLYEQKGNEVSAARARSQLEALARGR